MRKKQDEDRLEQLVSLSQGGDVRAFSDLYEMLLDDVYRYVYFKVRTEDAGDICSDIFLKVWEKLKLYRKQKNISFRAWIFRIAHNIVVDYYRKNRETVPIDEMYSLEDDSSHARVEDRVDINLSIEHLNIGLKRLKEEHQQALLLKFMSELSYQEMSAILGKSEGAVRIIVHRALKELQKVLSEGES